MGYDATSQGLKLLWQISTESNQGVFIINRATIGFSSILSKQSSEQKQEYLDKLAENIILKKPMCYLTIKILSSLLKSYDQNTEIIGYLESKHNL